MPLAINRKFSIYSRMKITEHCSLCNSSNLITKDSRVFMKRVPGIEGKMPVRQRTIKCLDCETREMFWSLPVSYFKSIDGKLKLADRFTNLMKEGMAG